MTLDFNEIIQSLLKEGARDNELAVYLPLFQKLGQNVTVGQLKQALLAKFGNEAGLNNLSLSSNYYLSGVARYYFNGDLTKNKRLGIFTDKADKFNMEVCQRLNALIEILRNGYIDSVGTKWVEPEDFGTLTIDKLLRKYNKKINKALGIDDTPKKGVEEVKPKINQSTKVNRKYDYEIIYNYEEAKKYYEWTKPGAWCITYGKQHYDGYVKRLGIHYVIFRMKGYEKVPRKIGNGWSKEKPQDLYGNSLIAVLQSNKNGEPIYITSRWNHGTEQDGTRCEADHAYTKEEFLNVIGDDGSVLQRAFEQWQANKPQATKKNSNETRQKNLGILRQIKYAQMMINGGANPSDYFQISLMVQGNENKPWKGTVIGQMTIDGERYQMLIDRKQIIFPTISNYTYCGDSYSRNIYNNVLQVHLDGYQGKQLLFDLKRHRLIDVDGVLKFGDIGSFDKWKKEGEQSAYCTVAASSTQVALINLQSGKAIRLPNGDYWVERIGSRTSYGREVVAPRINDDATIIKLQYDMASGEVYYYNMLTHSFLDLNDSELADDGWKTDTRYEYEWSNYIRYKKQVGEYEYDGNSYPQYAFKFRSTRTMDFVNIGGYDTFKNFSDEDDMCAFEPYGENKVYFFNKITNDFVHKPNGELFVGNGGNKWGHLGFGYSKESGFYELNTNYQREGNRTWLYMPQLDMFYHDDISGYEFQMYGHTMMYDPRSTNGKKYYIPKAKDVIKQMEMQQESVKKQFNIMLERLIRH